MAKPPARTPDPKLGWTDPADDYPSHVFMEIDGGTASGRSHLALTAPWPCAYLSSAEKTDGLDLDMKAEKRRLKRNDYIKFRKFGRRYTGPESKVMKEAREDFDTVIDLMHDAMQWARTIIIDSHTALWEVLRLAHFGRPANVKPHHYGPPNSEWRNFAYMCRDQEKTDVNVIMVGQVGERYYNDKPTGQDEPKGAKEMQNGYLPDIIIRCSRGDDNEFLAEIKKAWYREALRGKMFEGKQVDFQMIMDTLTGAEDERWGG